LYIANLTLCCAPVQVYPASKIFALLLETTQYTRNQKSRAEALSEMAALTERLGLEQVRLGWGRARAVEVMADEPRCMHAILDGPGVRAKDLHGTLGRCAGFRGEIGFFLMRWAINDHRAQTLRCAFPARLYRPLAPSSLSATLASGMLPWTCSSHRSRHTVCKFHSLDPRP